MFQRVLLLMIVSSLSFSCGKNQNENLVLEGEGEVLGEGSTTLPSETNKENGEQQETLVMNDSSLQKAYDSFLQQGVPSIPLTRAFEFYRENRASLSGLRDSSCLIKPMSETGEIAKDSNRYDPTTLQMLKTGIRNERYIMVVDFTQSSSKDRGYLLDLKPDAQGKYKLTRMKIAHGYGSKAVNGVPQVFTNSAGKGTTVSGFFVTGQKTYKYYGTASGSSYSSIGLRMYGLESTNNTAERTSKVSHGAPYVTTDRAGNSAGCPAMMYSNATKWLPQLTGGILWYHHTKINNSLSYKAPSCVKSTIAKK